MLAFASTAEAFSAAPLRSAPSARASLSMLDGKTTLDSDGGPLGPVTSFAAPSVTAYPEAGATAWALSSLRARRRRACAGPKRAPCRPATR